MAKFRKKPIVIDAYQFVPGGQPLVESWMIGHEARDRFSVIEDAILIHTLEGAMRANPGDWIIRGVKGEFYPIKDEIFAATYEPADASPQPDALKAAEVRGWNACRRQVYLLSEHVMDNTPENPTEFQRGCYSEAKAFAKTLGAFEADDCDFLKEARGALLSKYGLALMMIREGCANPGEVAAKALDTPEQPDALKLAEDVLNGFQAWFDAHMHQVATVTLLPAQLIANGDKALAAIRAAREGSRPWLI